MGGRWAANDATGPIGRLGGRQGLPQLEQTLDRGANKRTKGPLSLLVADSGGRLFFFLVQGRNAGVVGESWGETGGVQCRWRGKGGGSGCTRPIIVQPPAATRNRIALFRVFCTLELNLWWWVGANMAECRTTVGGSEQCQAREASTSVAGPSLGRQPQRALNFGRARCRGRLTAHFVH